MNKDEMFFDSVAYKWDEMVKHDGEKIGKVLDLLDIKGSESILDIGTGTGVLIPFLMKRLGAQGRITALDISAKMLEIAESKHKSSQVGFIKLDFMEAELAGAYDIVLCYSCFPHLKDRYSAVRKMLRALKKDGKLLIFHSESREKINQLHGSMESHVKEDKLPTAEELRDIIETEGGKVTHLEDSEEKYVVAATK